MVYLIHSLLLSTRSARLYSGRLEPEKHTHHTCPSSSSSSPSCRCIIQQIREMRVCKEFPAETVAARHRCAATTKKKEKKSQHKTTTKPWQRNATTTTIYSAFAFVCNVVCCVCDIANARSPSLGVIWKTCLAFDIYLHSYVEYILSVSLSRCLCWYLTHIACVHMNVHHYVLWHI